MANKNAILKDKDENSIFPKTFDFNVFNSNNQSLDNIIANIDTTKMKVFSYGTYDCNACYDSGLYQIAGGSNCPSGSQYGTLLVLPYRKPFGNSTPDFATQIFLPNGDDATKPNSMFYRTSLSTAWNSWNEENALIASGTSSNNAHYLKYSSGLLVIWGSDSGSAGTFPIPFASKPGVGYGNNQSGNSYAITCTVTSTSLTFKNYSERVTTWVAVGTWF